MRDSFLILMLSLAFAFTASASGGKGKSKYIDLTYSFDNSTVTFPGREFSFHIELEGEIGEGIWVASRGFCTSEHTSTHIDSPYHVARFGKKLDEIPLEDLLDLPGVMIDVYDKVHHVDKAGNVHIASNYMLTIDDVLQWERKNGPIPQGAVVLLRSGWGSRWGNVKQFRGEEDTDAETTSSPTKEKKGLDLKKKLNFPGYGLAAGRYLAVERQVSGIGIDTLSIDPGNSKTYPVHVLFGKRNIWMLENVANLHLLPPRGFNVFVVPFKIDRATGAPTRVLAKLND